ncbi:polysaccharide biosynthesis protein [Alicyclobacillus fastidiosus]|uniref:Polysaccharide biosynthesis protein n=2 Tax=Alicyclobacillus fastidiosus TaxID=392011 RepID=A0ABY6ZH39_9BACL|nr:polysaccharide biosynthesis protein [Alicyclobacillus fastidiosus]WAH42210.1 polysaccharide biosynthesis protein [Alicyclobacillus fastidiosus]
MIGSRNFVRGAMLLAGAAMLSKFLGSIYTIVLQNIIGDHGMGLFQMAYPIYATLLAVATAGFPVAISKLVAEEVADGNPAAAKQVLRVAAWLLSLGGVFAFLVLYLFAPEWAVIAGDPESVSAIRAISPALLVVPILSVLRGYFQGYQWMDPTAFSQVLEQLVRVATIIGLSVYFVDIGASQRVSAAGAAFGAVTGALAGFIAMLVYWRRRGRFIPEDLTRQKVDGRTVTKKLIYYAFPISIGALVVPLLHNVDVITVVNLLKRVGESQNLATTQFGLLSGRAFKLTMLPTTLAAGIGVAVMPAISEAFTLGHRELLANRVDMALRLTVLLALPATAGLVLAAKPINVALFTDADGTAAIQVLALSILFASIQTTTAALLQGAGWIYRPIVYMLVSCLVKLVANFIFVPRYGIAGAAFATVISYIVAAVLNLHAVRHLFGDRLALSRWLYRPLIATTIMSGAVFALERQWEVFGGPAAGRLWSAVATLVILGAGVAVYLFAILVSGSLSEEELMSIPHIGPLLARVSRRFFSMH